MKTIDEAADAYVKNNFYIGTISDKISTQAHKAFKAGVKFAQQWIRVEDELPEENVYVLVKCTNGKRTQFDIDYLLNGKFHKRTNVTRWRPIELEL